MKKTLSVSYLYFGRAVEYQERVYVLKTSIKLITDPNCVNRGRTRSYKSYFLGIKTEIQK